MLSEKRKLDYDYVGRKSPIFGFQALIDVYPTSLVENQFLNRFNVFCCAYCSLYAFYCIRFLPRISAVYAGTRCPSRS